MTDKPRKAFVCAEFVVDVDVDVDAFHQHGNDVMDEMLKLEACNDGVNDSAVSTDAENRIITLELVVTAADDFSAIAKAVNIMHTAAHAAGTMTAAWPRADEVAGALTSVAEHYRHRETHVREAAELASA